MSIQQLNIGDPANPANNPVTGTPYTSPVAIPDVANQAGGRLLFLNRTGATLAITLYANRYALTLEPGDKRLVELNTPEQQGFTFAVLASDLGFVNTPRLDVELYAPGEVIPAPFESGVGTAVPAMLTPDAIAITFTGDPTTGLASTGVIEVTLPVAGLYQASALLETLDSNTGSPGADLIELNWNWSQHELSADLGTTIRARMDMSTSPASDIYLNGANPVPGPSRVHRIYPVFFAIRAPGPPITRSPGAVTLQLVIHPLATPPYASAPSVRVSAVVTLIGV